MSRVDRRRVRVRLPDGSEVEIPCLWIPRSGDKVLVVWRIGSAPVGSAVLHEGRSYVVLSIAPNDEITEGATLGAAATLLA